MSALQISDVTVHRGVRPVVRDVTLEVPAGEVVALLGANGAGKSSLVLALAGRLPLAGGTVVLDGASVGGLRPHRVRAAGLAAVPEGHQVLSGLDVHDNLRAAVLDPHHEAEALATVYELFPELESRRDQRAGSLSGGQQQMLAIAQALASRPRYLLVDELSLGLAPIIVARLAGTIAAIAEHGIGVLLIEQYAAVALGLARHAAVMERGQIVWSGSTEALRADPSVLHGVYLGAAPSA